MTGETISHYRVLERLGVGGMSVVFTAEDTVLGRRVALKFPSASLQLDQLATSRFLREARSVSTLSHANICTIYEAGEHDGRLFLAMELVDGVTLRERIASGPFTPTAVLDLAGQVADALDAAHAAGLVHRDIKPTNIMITRRGQAKIMDFGLVKLLPRDAGLAAEGPGALATETLLTDVGTVVGTFAYMSPEQARGALVDARSDLFSFGAVLYEMATGRRAFEGTSQAVIFDGILNRVPAPVAQRNPSMPARLQLIISKMLEKGRDARYQSAAELRADLGRLKQQLEAEAATASAQLSTPGIPPARRDKDPWHRDVVPPQPTAGLAARAWWLGTAAIGLLALVTGGMAWVTLSRRPAPAPPFQSPTLEQVTFRGNTQVAAISPDGRYVVHNEWDGHASSLWVRQVATASHVPIVPPAEGEFDGVTFSADGQYVYYVWYAKDSTTGIVYRIPALGGPPRLVIEDVDTPVAFSPDGTRFAFIRTAGAQTKLTIAGIDGSAARVLASRTAPKQFLPIDLGWSPDGNFVATAERDRRDATVRLLVVDVRTGDEHYLTDTPWYGFGGLVWLPGGRGLIATGTELPAATTGNQVFEVPWPAAALRRISSDPANYSGPRLTADGRTLVLVREDRNARLWNLPLADDSKMTSIGLIGDGVSGLDVAPDGAIVYTSMASGRPDLWLAEPGKPPRPLTFDGASELVPRFTPDGQQIVYYVIRGTASTLSRIGRDGTGPTVLAATTPRSWNAPTSSFVTSDARWVLFTDSTEGIARVSFAGGQVERVGIPALARVGQPISLLALAPDGAKMAVSYFDAEQRRNRVAVVASDGRSLTSRLDLPGGAPGVGGRPVQFGADGAFLYFASTRDGVGNVFKVRVLGGAPIQVTRFQSDVIARFALAPDGTTMAVSRGSVRTDVVLLRDERPGSR